MSKIKSDQNGPRPGKAAVEEPAAKRGHAVARNAQPEGGAVDSPPGNPWIAERLAEAIGKFVQVNVTSARNQLPRLVDATASGTVFLISNAKCKNAPPALLIGIAELERLIRHAAEPVPSRTMKEILDSLPHSDLVVRSVPMPRLKDSKPSVIHIPK